MFRTLESLLAELRMCGDNVAELLMLFRRAASVDENVMTLFLCPSHISGFMGKENIKCQKKKAIGVLGTPAGAGLVVRRMFLFWPCAFSCTLVPLFFAHLLACTHVLSGEVFISSKA
jgi:hypothetical protein